LDLGVLEEAAIQCELSEKRRDTSLGASGKPQRVADHIEIVSTERLYT
jgi:hypothetical protein